MLYKRNISPLIISYSYGKLSNAVGQVDRALFQNLPDFYTPTIVTSDLFEEENLHSHKIIYIKENNFLNTLSKFIRHSPLKEIAYSPDIIRFTWQKRVEKRINNILNTQKFDYIHSTSMPYSDHLIANYIKKKYKIPWVAQFYEPWTDNNYRPLKHRYFIERDRKLEKIVVDNADLIIHDSDMMSNHWKHRYGKEIAKKIVTLHMPFDVSKCNREIVNKSKTNKLTIAHIGSFYHKRNSIDFIEGLSLFLKKEPQKRGNIEIIFVGVVTEEDYNIIRRKKLEDIVKIVGKVSEIECNHYYNKADIFLAVDGDNNDNLFYPSKVLKYYYYNKPILGLINQGSVLSSELQKAGHRYIDKSDHISIAKYISSATSNYKSLLDFDFNYWKYFTDSYVVEKYDSFIKELLKI